MIQKTIIFYLLVLFVVSCKKPQNKKAIESIDVHHAVLEKVTDVIIHDIFSPPVSSRIYAYTALAGYEAMVPGYPEYQTTAGQLNGLEAFPKPEAGQEYCYPLASAKAMMTIARTLTFSVDKYDEFEKQLYEKFENAGLPNDVIDRSNSFGEAIANHVLAYSKKDNYAQTRGLRYSVKVKSNLWVPTPPTYADAVEPYWQTIRTLVMDSAAQFKPSPVILYQKQEGSPFKKEVREVYEIVKNLSQEQKDIAWFWDDNSFVMNVQGHVSYANKKMTPAGHWIAITKTVCKNKNTSSIQSANAYLHVSLALFEGFISCWHAKYSTQKVRPETVINAEIDQKWQPFLQTPPFPEYTSGHSTISSASAEVLTALIGDNFAFTDSTELKYDHGVRSFKSFRDAAKECSVSRVYGGIHYTSACNEGLKVGAQIGQYTVTKIKTRK
ncbi:MAG: vanadium-dependent haloperoxidase [Leadbetterella sp.]